MTPSQRCAEIERLLRQGTLGNFETEILHGYAVGFSDEEVRDLITTCDTLLEDRAHGEADQNRIGTVKLLVALLPASSSSVRKWLSRMGDVYFYEVQFTFFCFLNDILSFTPPDPATATDVLEMVREYLNRVPSDEAHNAFMAADMLGDHWIGDAGINALVEVARHFRNPVGKKAALGALQDALRKGKVSPRYLP